MRIFAAQLSTETNTFASYPTGWRSFTELGLYHRDASRADPLGVGAILAEWRGLSESDGHEFAEGLCATAEPAGRTLRSVYESLRDEIVDALARARPVDIVLLALHGAMVAEDYDDCEGDLLERVRALVGPGVVIGVELDLHCHFTERMRRNADLIIAFKEYPHVDGLDRARELYRLATDAARRTIKPLTAVYDCRMVSLWFTTTEPMKSFVARMQSLEGRDGILSISFGHGFPWGDVADGGAKVWVIADGDEFAAAALARTLGSEIWEMREATRSPAVPIDTALDRGLRAAGCAVLADVADNAGGGAPSDSTFVLRRILERGIGNVASGFYWDPGAIEFCKDAGPGATLDLRVGGKCGPNSGDPLDLRVTVTNVLTDYRQSGLNMRWPLGTVVALKAAGDIDIVLTSIRSQVLSPAVFSDLGIDLRRKQLAVVKSTQHFYAQFAPLAADVIYVAAPGAITPDFAAIPYRARGDAYWPRVSDPFPTADSRA